MKVRGYVLACLSAISYGTIPLFAIPLKRLDMGFDSVLFYRFLFTTLLIGLYLAGRKVSLRVSRKELGVLLALGAIFSLSSHFLFTSYNYMPASVASTILFVYPVFVAILMAVFFKEKIVWTVALAIALAFTGVCFLNESDGGAASGVSLAGVLIGMLSALAYAVYMIVINKSAVRHMSGPKLTFYSMMGCTLFFLVKAAAQGGLQPIPTVEAGVLMLLFGLVSTVISCITLVYAIQYIGSTPTAIMGALEPVVAVAISVLLFGENFTANLAVGIVFVITAVMVVILSDRIARRVKTLRPSGRRGAGRPRR